MIIDAHTHLGKPGGAINSRAKDLLEAMDKAKIDKAMVFAGRINSISAREVLAEIAPHKDRLYAIGSASLHEERTRDMEELLAEGSIFGMKFYPGYEYFFPGDSWVQSWGELLVKYNKPAIFHSGDTFAKVGKAKLKYALPIHIDDLATEVPNLKIIIAHMGFPWEIDAAEVCYKNKNVYADCSGFTYGSFDMESNRKFLAVWKRFVDIAGTKVLFGTDWPISEPSSYVTAAENAAHQCKYAQSDWEMMFHGHAEYLFGI